MEIPLKLWELCQKPEDVAGRGYAGEGHGYLLLKVQVNTGGDRVWTAPLDPAGNKAVTNFSSVR